MRLAKSAGRFPIMKRRLPRTERPSNSTAQLALPGLDAPVPRPAFDLFAVIRDTFRKRVPDGEVPVIKVSRRMVRTLGSFTPSKNMIRLSSRLLALGTPEEQEHVALHEVAHAIVHQRDPEASAHGKEFRAACKELGLVAGRFVEIDHAAWRERMRFAVDCPACGEKVLRRKRSHRVRCACGAAMRPRSWTAVGLTERGLKPL